MKLKIIDAVIGLAGTGFGIYMAVMWFIDMIWWAREYGLDDYDLKMYIVLLLLIAIILYASLRLLVGAIIFFIKDYKENANE